MTLPCCAVVFVVIFAANCLGADSCVGQGAIEGAPSQPTRIYPNSWCVLPPCQTELAAGPSMLCRLALGPRVARTVLGLRLPGVHANAPQPLRHAARHLLAGASAPEARDLEAAATGGGDPAVAQVPSPGPAHSPAQPSRAQE